MGVDQQQKTFFQGRWQLDQEVKEVQFYGQEWYKLINSRQRRSLLYKLSHFGRLINHLLSNTNFDTWLHIYESGLFSHKKYPKCKFLAPKIICYFIIFGYMHMVTDLQSILPSIFKQLLKHKKVLEFSRGIYQISTKVLKLKSEAKNRLSSWECML